MSSETDPDYQVDPTALARARTFEKAMKGWGTDEAALINLTASLRPEEIAPLRFAYVSSIGGDLVDEVKGETSGNFKAALAALLTPVAKYDANLCREATQGFGTNEQVLIEVFCTRTLDELKDFSKCYFLTHIRYLETDLKAKLDGDFLELLLQRLTGTEEKGDIPGDVERLFFAKQDKDAAAFIPILCHRSSEYVRELNTAYANQHGASLATVIDESLSGDVKKALMAIVTPPADYFAELLYKAMKGFGTDDSTLIRVIASQRFRHLKDIAAVYLNRYGVSLKHAISDELSGDYKKLILAVLEFVLEGEIPAVL